MTTHSLTYRASTPLAAALGRLVAEWSARRILALGAAVATDDQIAAGAHTDEATAIGLARDEIETEIGRWFTTGERPRVFVVNSNGPATLFNQRCDDLRKEAAAQVEALCVAHGWAKGAEVPVARPPFRLADAIDDAPIPPPGEAVERMIADDGVPFRPVECECPDPCGVAGHGPDPDAAPYTLSPLASVPVEALPIAGCISGGPTVRADVVPCGHAGHGVCGDCGWGTP